MMCFRTEHYLLIIILSHFIKIWYFFPILSFHCKHNMKRAISLKEGRKNQSDIQHNIDNKGLSKTNQKGVLSCTLICIGRVVISYSTHDTRRVAHTSLDTFKSLIMYFTVVKNRQESSLDIQNISAIISEKDIQ